MTDRLEEIKRKQMKRLVREKGMDDGKRAGPV